MNQSQQHDWLADVGEKYVAYLFSRDKRFEVFGSGKWDADCVLHDKKLNKWIRIEVKSSDSKKSFSEVRGPAKRRVLTQVGKFEALFFVSIQNYAVNIEVYKVKNKKIDKNNLLKNPT